jgi:YVTN family beta-propeller protein
MATATNPYAYVCNTTSASISVVDVDTLSVVATISLSGNPLMAELSFDGLTLYVLIPDATQGHVAVIDTTTNTLTATVTPSNLNSLWLCANADFCFACGSPVTYPNPNYLSVIDPSGTEVHSIALQGGSDYNETQTVVITNDGKYVYGTYGTYVNVLSTASLTIVDYQDSSQPIGYWAVMPNSEKIYGASKGGSPVAEMWSFLEGSATILNAIAIDSSFPDTFIGCSGDNQWCLVPAPASMGGEAIYSVSTATDTATVENDFTDTAIPIVGSSPNLPYSFAVDTTPGDLQVYDNSTGMLTTTVSGFTSPGIPSMTLSGKYVLTASSTDDVLYVVSSSPPFSTVGSVAVGGGPNWIATLNAFNPLAPPFPPPTPVTFDIPALFIPRKLTSGFTDADHQINYRAIERWALQVQEILGFT